MSFTRMRYHFVTGTKSREPIITPELQPILYDYIRETAKSIGGRVVEIGGIEDHVHLLVALRPDVAPADFMRRIKGESTRRLAEQHREFDFFEWQSGYAGFTLSPFALDDLRSYIRNQKEHHRSNSIWQKFELIEAIEEAA